MLAAPAANAAPIVAYYEASWAGVDAATMVLVLDGEGETYRDMMIADTVGLARWLIHFRTRVWSDGVFAPDGSPRPAHYNVDYDLRRRKNHRIRMTFTMRGGVLVAERTVDDSSNKPPLPEQYRRDITDPMTAFAAIRHHLQRHAVKIGDRFTLALYDDVRRYDCVVTVVPGNQPGKLIHLHLDLKPIAGFITKHKEGADPEDAPRPLDVTFRNDAAMVPQELSVSVGWLPLTIEFKHYCADPAHCDDTSK